MHYYSNVLFCMLLKDIKLLCSLMLLLFWSKIQFLQSKQLCCLIFLWKIVFEEKNRKLNSICWGKKTCHIICVFTVTFDNFNASLLNKSITYSKNKQKNKKQYKMYMYTIDQVTCLQTKLWPHPLYSIGQTNRQSRLKLTPLVELMSGYSNKTEQCFNSSTVDFS